MKFIYTGLESQGKSLLLAQKVQHLAKRNRIWAKKYGFVRKIYSNLRFSSQFYEKNREFIQYFDDYREVITQNGIDIIWDEISTHFSALKREPLPRRINQWLRQGAKQGVHIYATAQEFHDVHLDFRRRCLECRNVIKMFGSRRPGKNIPPVKVIWGLCMIWNIKIHPYNELEPEKSSVIPSFLWISPHLCSVFDTGQVIKKSDEPPFEHIERVCERPDCDFKRTFHY